MARYADALIGNLVDHVTAGLGDDTLIIVTSDNGTPNRVGMPVHGRRMAGGNEYDDHGTRMPFSFVGRNASRPDKSSTR